MKLCSPPIFPAPVPSYSPFLQVASAFICTFVGVLAVMLGFLTVRESEISDAVWKVHLLGGSVHCGHQFRCIWPIYACVHEMIKVK